MKKVLFLITKATWGGAQRYVYDLSTHLPQEFEPIVAFGESGKLAADLSSAGIETRVIPSLQRDVAFLSDLTSFFGIWKCIRAAQPDVVHLNSSKAAAFGALAARLRGVPNIIFTVHGWPFNEKRGELARVMIYLISWLTAVLSHAVIVVSKSDEAQGKQMRGVGKKVRYIPIGIEAPVFLPRGESSSALDIATDTPRIVTIAELTPNKGIRYAIETIALLKDRGVEVSYTVIGDGEQRAELEDMAVEFSVEDRVRFAGFLADAPKYLKSFDVFLLPSIKEGMPYVLLEAAAAGLPIITTSVVNPEFVERAGNVHAIPPGDPDAIADAIQEVLDEGAEKEMFPAQHFFPLSEMVEETAELYLPAQAST